MPPARGAVPSGRRAPPEANLVVFWSRGTGAWQECCLAGCCRDFGVTRHSWASLTLLTYPAVVESAFASVGSLVASRYNGSHSVRCRKGAVSWDLRPLRSLPLLLPKSHHPFRLALSGSMYSLLPSQNRHPSKLQDSIGQRPHDRQAACQQPLTGNRASQLPARTRSRRRLRHLASKSRRS